MLTFFVAFLQLSADCKKSRNNEIWLNVCFFPAASPRLDGETKATQSCLICSLILTASFFLLTHSQPCLPSFTRCLLGFDVRNTKSCSSGTHAKITLCGKRFPTHKAVTMLEVWISRGLRNLWRVCFGYVTPEPPPLCYFPPLSSSLFVFPLFAQNIFVCCFFYPYH